MNVRRGSNTRRILFIHIQFYEYNKEIVCEMERLGYEVDQFCENHRAGLIGKIVAKFDRNYYKKKNQEAQLALLAKIVEQKVTYEKILVIKGEELGVEFLRGLRNFNPNAEFILYLWDDVKRIRNFVDVEHLYDRKLTFDRIDARKFGMEHLPLFYCSFFRSDTSRTFRTIDFLFIGYNHSDRERFLLAFISANSLDKRRCYFHLFTPAFPYLISRLLNGKLGRPPRHVRFDSISLRKCAQLMHDSKVVIDLQHESQTGLTMRTIEALAAGCKVATTNSDILHYDIFDPDKVVIVDRERPIIHSAFLDSSYLEANPNKIEGYSIRQWVAALLMVASADGASTSQEGGKNQ